MGCTTRSRVLQRIGATQAEIARLIGCSESSVSRKFQGHSPWLLREALKVQTYLERRYGARLELAELENGRAANG